MTTANRQRLCAASAAAAWLVAALGYLMLEAIAAAGFRPHYSYAHDFISDLGVTSTSPLAYLMNAAFCLQGILFLVGAVLIVGALGAQRAGLFLGFAAANAVGNLVVAAVHSGSVAHANGTIWVHEIGALLAIVGGNAAIMAGSAVVGGAGGPRWYRGVSIGLATLGLLSFLLLVLRLKVAALNFVAPAVWERGSVYSIIAGQIFTAAYLFVRSR